MSIISTFSPRGFPPAVRSYVGAFVLRRRSVLLLRAIGAALALALAWVLVAVLADRALHLSAFSRRILLVTGIALTIAVLLRGLLRVLRPVNWVDVAARIERHTSVFGQRLQTVTSQLLLPPTQRGSEQMLGDTLRETEALASKNGGAALVPWRLALPSWIVAATLALVLVILWQIPTLHMSRLLARLAHPSLRIEPVTLTRLEIEPRGAEVFQGGAVTVRASVEGEPGAVELYLSTDGRHWSHAEMTSPAKSAQPTAEQARFEFQIPAIDRDLHYFVRAGDARTDDYQIKVKRVPAAAEFRIQYDYPLYTGRGSTSVINTDGQIAGLINCQATITVIATEPLASADLLVDGQRLPMTSTGKPTEWSVKLRILQNAKCALEMISSAGVLGHGPSPMPLRAIPDREPSVVIEQPTNDLRLAPSDALTLRFRAIDDYGLTGIEAVVQINSASAVVFQIPVPVGALRQEGSFPFELADFDPKIGDVVTLSIRATDTNDQQATSDARRVLIAPISVGSKAFARAAELKRASDLATAWVDAMAKARAALDQARAVDPRNPKQEHWTRAQRTFTTATDAAGSLRQALLRVIVRSESRPLSVALAGLVDETTAQVIEPGRILSPMARTDEALSARLNASLAKSRDLGAKLKVLLAGEQASLAQAELANDRAIAAALAQNKTALEIRTKARQSALRMIDAILRELALNAKSQNLQGELQGRVDREKTLVASEKPVDFAAAAAEWAQRLAKPGTPGGHFAARLMAASQAEALRQDADLALARDLQLASRAAAALMQEMVALRDERAHKGDSKTDARTEARVKLMQSIAQFEAGFRALSDRDHAAAARARLRAWAAETQASDVAEDAAFEAGAESALHQFDRVGQLDNKLASEIRRSSEEEYSRLLEDLTHLAGEAEDVDKLLGRQEELHTMPPDDQANVAAMQEDLASAIEALARVRDAATQPSADPRDAAESLRPAPAPEAAARNPLAAAAWYARSAANGLRRSAGGAKVDPTAIAASQQEAARLLGLAWSALIQRAATRRLEELPSLSSLFEPYAPEEPGAHAPLADSWPRYGTRFHEWMRADPAAPLRQSEPSEFQEPLKAYFDAIIKGKR